MGDKIERARQALGEIAADTAQQVADACQQAQADRDLMQQGLGFKSAAGITQRLFQKRFDAMEEKLKSGTLIKAEQPVYEALKSLLADIERESERYWRSSPIEVNWRPVKRVVKGAVLRAPEEQDEPN